MKRKKNKSNLDEHWGYRLQKVMAEKDLSQRDVADICKTSVSVVSAWIKKGSSPADLNAIKELVDNMKVSFTWLLTGAYESGATQPSVTEIFEESPYFDGYARIRIDRLIPKKGKKDE